MLSARVLALYLSLLGCALSTPSPTPSGCWKLWTCTGETADSEYYCTGAGVPTPCSMAKTGCSAGSWETTESCTNTMGEVSGGTCADMVGPWGSEYIAGTWYCDADVCGADYCAAADSEGCYKYWTCTGEIGSENQYYCDMVGQYPCSISYTGCTAMESEDDGDIPGCRIAFGEVAGTPCDSMVGPFGPGYPKDTWICTGAEGCANDCPDNVSAAASSSASLVTAGVAAVVTMLAWA